MMFQEKPNSMSVKDWLVKKMSIDLVIKESIINAVVTHQFNSANDAFKNNSSVELSGFGKFIFNKRKAEKKLQKYYDTRDLYISKLEITPSDSSLQRRLDSVLEEIKVLEPKLKNNGRKD
jgi:nucleoid DNA-binding protein